MKSTPSGVAGTECYSNHAAGLSFLGRLLFEDGRYLVLLLKTMVEGGRK